MRSTNKWLIGTLVFIVILIAVFLVILWKLGIFDLTTMRITDNLAPVLALASALIGSIITAIGMFLKHSYDQRNINLSEQAEKRLAQEAVLQAIQSFSTSSGAEVPMVQRAGILFALANLGQLDLAITILGQLLQSDSIDGYSASCLIDRALKSDNVEIQHEASIHLVRHAKKFLEEKGHASFPESLLYRCNTKLPVSVRENGVIALLDMMSARSYAEWHPGVIGNLILTLCIIWKEEPDVDLKNGVGHCLCRILNVYPEGNILQSHHGGQIIIDELRNMLNQHTKERESCCSGNFLSLAENLEKWSKITNQ